MITKRLRKRGLFIYAPSGVSLDLQPSLAIHLSRIRWPESGRWKSHFGNWCNSGKTRQRKSSGKPELFQSLMVPKKGLEPPHPCGYMDLNHARLPIPPLRRGKLPSKQHSTGWQLDHSTGVATASQRCESKLSWPQRLVRHDLPSNAARIPSTCCAASSG
jgi:hypothetical protein